MGNAILKSPDRSNLLAAELNEYVEQLEIKNAEAINYLQNDFIEQDSPAGDKKSALDRSEQRLLLLDQSCILRELSDLVDTTKREFRDADKHLIEGRIFTERRSSYNKGAPSLMGRAARAGAESQVLRIQIEQLRDKL